MTEELERNPEVERHIHVEVWADTETGEQEFWEIVTDGYGQVLDRYPVDPVFNVKPSWPDSEFHRLDHLVGQPPTPPIIEGVLYENSLSTLFAPFDSGKSFVALDIALHIANGKSWAGRDVQQGWVAYLLAEGQRSFGKRALAWQEHHGGSLENVAILGKTFNMRDNIERGDVEYQVKKVMEFYEKPPILVIIDPLIEYMGSESDSDSRSMNQFREQMRKVRDNLGCAIMIVTHTAREDTTHERGSTVLGGAMDTRIKVRPTFEKKQLVRVKLTCEKQKDEERFEDIVFATPIVETSSGKTLILKHQTIDTALEDVDDAPSMTVQRQSDMLKILRFEGSLAPQKWLELSEMPKSTFYKYARQLVQEGLVRKVGDSYVPVDDE